MCQSAEDGLLLFVYLYISKCLEFEMFFKKICAVLNPMTSIVSSKKFDIRDELNSKFPILDGVVPRSFSQLIRFAKFLMLMNSTTETYFRLLQIIQTRLSIS